MSSLQPAWPSMSEAVQRIIRGYLKALRKPLDAQLEGVILYGSLVRGEYVEGHSNINLLLILHECSLANLQHVAQLTEKWRKHGIIPPLLLTEEELRQSVEYFPLEYFEIKDNHVLLEGRDPFLIIHINDQNLGLQCQQELNGNLLRVRQRFVEGYGRPEAIAALLPLSLMALLPCLRGLCRALGHPSGGTSEAFLSNLPHTLQVGESAFLEVLEVKQGLRSPGKHAWPQLFNRYVRDLEQVIHQVRETRPHA
ncbi:MAG: hypothetical protein NPIRA04_32900 [Nitrospirales bacterium]|nr:MAG: hypothetical protein NPIRA04_32900 [Nitrospirales bacterium]